MRQRRAHNEVKHAAMRYMASVDGPVNAREIKLALEPDLGTIPDSTIRSTLQDRESFECVAIGRYELKRRP